MENEILFITWLECLIKISSQGGKKTFKMAGHLIVANAIIE